MNKLALTIGTTLGLAAFGFAISADAQKTPAQLNSEFQTCAAQGKGPNCITVTNMQDIIGTLTSGTVASVAQYGATTSSSDNSAAFQSAVNAARTVFVPSGTWNICAQVTLPVGEHILSYDSNPNPGSNGPNEAWSNTIITCQTTGSFSNGQAFLALQDHDVVEGLSIYGLNQIASGLQLNCINALNAISVTIKYNAFIDCYNGLSRYSNGNVSGASEAYSQLAVIEGNLFYGNTEHGYYAAYANGGFVSDDTIGPDNDFVVNGSSQIYINGGPYYTGMIVGNRIEDQNGTAYGIDIENMAFLTITGNNFDKIQALYINGGNDINVTGNRDSCCLSSNGYDVEFAGTNTNMNFAGNDWEGYQTIYRVDVSGSVNGYFAERPSGATGSGVFSPQYYDLNSYNILSILRPIVTNLSPGAPTFTSGWSATDATLATGIAGDPTGNSNAASITENNTDTSHYVITTNIVIPANGIYTAACDVSSGSSGSRNIGIFVTDNGSNYAGELYTVSNGNTIYSLTGGTGDIITAGFSPLGGGWYEEWMTFTMGTTTNLHLQVALVSGTNTSYTGNSTANNLLFNCQVIPGASPP